MPSSFNSAEPFSASWQYIDGPVNNTCATQGRSFIGQLRRATRVTSPGEYIWNDDVQAALVAKALSFKTTYPNQGWESVYNELVADQTARRISGMSLVFAIYTTFYMTARGRLAAIRVAPNTVLPMWGIAPPDDSSSPLANGSLVCFSPTADPPPSSLSRSQLAAAAEESRTGMRVGEGRPVPPDPGVVDPGFGAGFGPWGITAAAMAIVGMGYLVTRSSAARPRNNPRKKSRRSRRSK